MFYKIKIMLAVIVFFEILKVHIALKVRVEPQFFVSDLFFSRPIYPESKKVLDKSKNSPYQHDIVTS
jgi:hypothetical protein